MKKTKKPNRLRHGELTARAYAWIIQNEKHKWVLCRWAEPYPDRLKTFGKPSPEAKIVRVTLHTKAMGWNTKIGYCHATFSPSPNRAGNLLDGRKWEGVPK